MSKKIIIAVVLLLSVAIVFAACKDKNFKEVDKVTNEKGEEIIIYEDEDGTKYVENKDGDKVAIVPDKDGFYDDLDSLVENPTEDKNKNEGNTIVVGNDDGEASIDWNDIVPVS